MPTDHATLISEARRLTRLQAKRRKLRKQLRDVDAEIRLSKKHLRALTKSINGKESEDQAPPLRGFDEGGGGFEG